MWEAALRTTCNLAVSTLQIHYHFDGDEMEGFKYLHSLSRLEEASLRFTVYNPEARPTVFPEAAGGLPALRRLDIGCVYDIRSLPVCDVWQSMSSCLLPGHLHHIVSNTHRGPLC